MNFEHVSVNGVVLEDEYGKKVEELRREWSIGSSSIDSEYFDALFRMAIDHDALFREQGRGFQDAVILFSAIDDLSKHPATPGALLTRDSGLDNQHVRDLIAVRFN